MTPPQRPHLAAFPIVLILAVSVLSGCGYVNEHEIPKDTMEPTQWTSSCTRTENCIDEANLRCGGSVANLKWRSAAQALGGFGPIVRGKERLTYSCGASSTPNTVEFVIGCRAMSECVQQAQLRCAGHVVGMKWSNRQSRIGGLNNSVRVGPDNRSLTFACGSGA